MYFFTITISTTTKQGKGTQYQNVYQILVHKKSTYFEENIRYYDKETMNPQVCIFDIGYQLMQMSSSRLVC